MRNPGAPYTRAGSGKQIAAQVDAVCVTRQRDFQPIVDDDEHGHATEASSSADTIAAGATPSQILLST